MLSQSTQLTDEAQTLARDGADQVLASSPLSPSALRAARYDPAAPNRTNEIVLADDSISALDQVNQEVKDLRRSSAIGSDRQHSSRRSVSRV
jgi:hypothetical protein